mgnify:FL=1|jgi:phosphoglucosamine mutase
MKKLFGTDGIRGIANKNPMTAEVALRVALAVGKRFPKGSHGRKIVIGKDTRLSGYMLEPALTAGFISMGMNVVLLGPLPTPAVALLTRSLRADLGVVISASHNHYQDNGIKFFDRQGYKFSDAVEKKIEENFNTFKQTDLIQSEKLGKAYRLDDAQGRYIEFVKNTFPKDLRLDGLKIVVDCANGAAYKIAPTVFWELGADVIPIGTEPNGFNINKGCGALDTRKLCQKVLKEKADLGIALDGDADRIIVVDEKGKRLDGDKILAIIAQQLKKDKKLRGSGVVGTVMSNMALENYLKEQDLKLYRSKVGDRYVVSTMKQKGCNVGGESSGHIILNDCGTTGDGTVAALQMLAAIKRSGMSVSEAGKIFQAFPQLTKNVPLNGNIVLKQKKIEKVLKQAKLELGRNGRLIVRPSGTEPLLRITAESESSAVNTRVANMVAEKVAKK